MIFYADKETDSIKRTVEIVNYRREKQIAYNQAHGITPRSVKRAAQASLHVYDGSGEKEVEVAEAVDDVQAVIAELEAEMIEASRKLEFERAAVLRDQIEALRTGDYKKVTKPKPAKYGKRSR